MHISLFDIWVQFQQLQVCYAKISNLEGPYEIPILIRKTYHPGKFAGENEAYKISLRWNRFGFSTSPVCIGNLSLPERNLELLMFSSEFLKFWYFPGDISPTVIGPSLTSVGFKIYTGYK